MQEEYLADFEARRVANVAKSGRSIMFVDGKKKRTDPATGEILPEWFQIKLGRYKDQDDGGINSVFFVEKKVDLTKEELTAYAEQFNLSRDKIIQTWKNNRKRNKDFVLTCRRERDKECLSLLRQFVEDHFEKDVDSAETMILRKIFNTKHDSFIVNAMNAFEKGARERIRHFTTPLVPLLGQNSCLRCLQYLMYEKKGYKLPPLKIDQGNVTLSGKDDDIKDGIKVLVQAQQEYIQGSRNFD